MASSTTPHALQRDPRRARTVHAAPMGCTEYVGQLQRTHDCFGTLQPCGVSIVPTGMAVVQVLQQRSCAQAEPQNSGCSCARVAQPWAWKSVHAEARPAPRTTTRTSMATVWLRRGCTKSCHTACGPARVELYQQVPYLRAHSYRDRCSSLFKPLVIVIPSKVSVGSQGYGRQVKPHCATAIRQVSVETCPYPTTRGRDVFRRSRESPRCGQIS